MKKKTISIFLCCILSVSLLTADTTEIYAAKVSSRLLCGITLDCSNRYYSVEDIEQYIDLVSSKTNGYVQLHFTGDTNVGIECEYLGQTADSEYVKNNDEYYNAGTGGSFLTKQQIQDILLYASQKNVRIIPEVDMPGHMGGFRELYVQKFGSDNAKNIFNSDYEGELLIGSKDALSFAKAIYSEYAELFAKCTYFHMGCDEFWSGSPKANAKYINSISGFLEGKGFKVLVWNDLLTKSNMKSLNKKLYVCYWSFDGDAQNKTVKADRRKTRASFTELQENDFRLINYNSYYLYFTPDLNNINQADVEYMTGDAKKNWNIGAWDSDSGHYAKSCKRIRGACVSIWGEDSEGVSNDEIYSCVKGLYSVVSSKCMKKYTIVFYRNGAKCKRMSSKVCYVNKSYRLPANKMKRKGYRFVGWITPSGKVIKNKATVTNLSQINGSKVILKAKWKKKTGAK